MELRVRVTAQGNGEGGVTVYSTELEHYDAAIRRAGDGWEVVLKLNIGGIRHVQTAIPLPEGTAEFLIRADSLHYDFYLCTADGEIHLGVGMSKYLSNEVSSPFTGVVLGLYAQGQGSQVRFDGLNVTYTF